jgi:membrane protein YqaA with SNARE-associated domain
MTPEAEALAVASGAAEAIAGRAARRDVGWRGWALVFAAFLAAGGSVLWLARGPLASPRLEILTLLLLYLSLACTFVPLPTAWIVLWAARETGALPVALVATAGTCIANLHDYHLVSALLAHRRLRRVRDGAGHVRAVAWFRRAPFTALAVASFAPLPIDAVRLLAISAGYGRAPYVLATFAGRFPRYLLLAVLGHELRPSNGVLAAVVVVIAVAAAAKLAYRHRHALLRRGIAAGSADDANR